MVSDAVILIESKLGELSRIAQSRFLPAGYVFRARLILMLAEGASFSAIQQKLGTAAPTIIRWKQRFLASGIDGVDVWDAIEDTRAQAENMKLRASLMLALRDHIEREGLRQSQAAKLLAVTQPSISDLMRGKIDLFAIDTLVNMLASAGLGGEMRIGATGVQREKVARSTRRSTPSKTARRTSRAGRSSAIPTSGGICAMPN